MGTAQTQTQADCRPTQGRQAGRQTWCMPSGSISRTGSSAQSSGRGRHGGAAPVFTSTNAHTHEHTHTRTNEGRPVCSGLAKGEGAVHAVPPLRRRGLRLLHARRRRRAGAPLSPRLHAKLDAHKAPSRACERDRNRICVYVRVCVCARARVCVCGRMRACV